MGTWVCKNCETENDDRTNVCTICGVKRDAQPTIESYDAGGSSYEDRYHQEYDARDQTRDDRKGRSEASLSDFTESTDDSAKLRERIQKCDRQKHVFRGLVIAFVIIQLGLFALPYINGLSRYTIYYNCTGIHGSIEQICSIMLVCITIAPAVVACVNWNVRERNLPVTIAVIAAILTTIYCAVIWFGNKASTFVPAAIILSAWLCMFFAARLVKTMNELDNAMYRPTGF